MALAVISRPTSHWSASANPVVYRMQRKDAGWNTITNNGGFTRVTINGVNLTAFIKVGLKERGANSILYKEIGGARVAVVQL